MAVAHIHNVSGFVFFIKAAPDVTIVKSDISLYN